MTLTAPDHDLLERLQDRFLNPNYLPAADEADIEDIAFRVLLRLPRDVAEWTAENVWFLSELGANAFALRVSLRPSEPSPASAALLCPHSPCTFLVVLCSSLASEPEDTIEFVIAHQIARHWSGASILTAGTAVFEASEAKANEFANSWGFHDSRDQAERRR